MAKLVVLIIIGLLILSFFGVSLRTLVLSPTAQDNFTFAWSIVLNGWDWLVAWINSVGASLSHFIPMGHENSAAVVKVRHK